MSGPFIVRSVSRIHPGKVDTYRPVAAEFCRLAEEREPRLLGFHIYVSEDRSSEVVIQIHLGDPLPPEARDRAGTPIREVLASAAVPSAGPRRPRREQSCMQ